MEYGRFRDLVALTRADRLADAIEEFFDGSTDDVPVLMEKLAAYRVARQSDLGRVDL